MASNVIFNPQEETIQEFLERFKVQCSDLLDAAEDNTKKKAIILVKALPVSVVTDLQRRIKPALLSDISYEEIIEKLTSQFEVRKSIIGATVTFLNRKQQVTESIENYAKCINDLAADCKYKSCCLDRSLRDTFICGLRSSAIISSLLPDCEDITLF